MAQTEILVISDELALINEMSRIFRREGQKVETSLSPAEAETRLDGHEYAVMFLDLKLADRIGAELLERVRLRYPEMVVVIILGPAPISAISETMGRGNFEYLPKPFNDRELLECLDRALLRREVMIKAREAYKIDKLQDFDELVGTGPAMRQLSQLISQIALHGAAIFIIGEFGSGKLLAAHAIHNASSRKYEPFVEFNPRLTSGLALTQELFGYYSGHGFSVPFIPGKIDEAGRGTLYIREVTFLNRMAQERLIKAIKERQFLPVYGKKPHSLSCRIIFATSEDLKSALERGDLIEEFYHNLSAFPIYLPPLSARTEDIPNLVYLFLHRYAQRMGKAIKRVDERLITSMLSRHWPGNVRELARCVERMVATCDGDMLTMEHYQLSLDGGGGSGGWNGRVPVNSDELKTVKKKLRQSAVEEVERAFLIEALNKSYGNVSQAAANTGIQRRNFQNMMRQYGIKGGS